MTTGDSNKYSVKAIYKDIEMRSILETKVASFLDALNIKWQYEPKVFTLSNGVTLIPDFYLTELKMWMEVKGDIEGCNKEIWKLFTKENNTETIILNGKEALFISATDYYLGGELLVDKWILLGKCSNCGSYFFCSNEGNYNCRKCLEHNGDHDIISFFSSYDNIFDFYSQEPILEQLKIYRTKI